VSETDQLKPVILPCDEYQFTQASGQINIYLKQKCTAVRNNFFCLSGMNSNDKIIEKVKDFANRAHGEQKRKFSQDPYIVHPMRVMTTCSSFTTDIAVLSAAILHDVIEDTPVTAKDISEFLRGIMPPEIAERTVGYVVELTDIYTRENYPRVNRRQRKQKEAERLGLASSDAQTIKYADILDNTDITRNDPDFAHTYLREARELLEKMTKGNAALREKTMQRVEQCIASLDPHPSVRTR
jgi:guanosine-3',5'-bis(diphosphate) 3'-pyrophosphohydrolase